jgi:hypothetical protein
MSLAAYSSRWISSQTCNRALNFALTNRRNWRSLTPQFVARIPAWNLDFATRSGQFEIASNRLMPRLRSLQSALGAGLRERTNALVYINREGKEILTKNFQG